ncbi:MAG: TM2 domain-containing protein [Acetobacterales bacterium]
MVYCRNCGNQIQPSAVTCPFCGTAQAPYRRGGKNKLAAALLAIFLGAFGIHRFYLGQWWGIFYLLLFWTAVPAVISFIEGIVFLLTDDERWEEKYGPAP